MVDDKLSLPGHGFQLPTRFDVSALFGEELVAVHAVNLHRDPRRSRVAPMAPIEKPAYTTASGMGPAAARARS